MTGEHTVTVSKRRLKYEFTLRENITILCGDSETGKSTLVDMLKAYNKHHNKSVVSVQSDVPCIVIDGGDWKDIISSTNNSIVFIDEGNEFIRTKEFVSCIRGTGNYYILITRQFLKALPYSIKEIYKLKLSDNYGSTQPYCNTFERIYNYT